jgi:hypothetical protein
VCGWDVRTLSTHHHHTAAGLKQQQEEREEEEDVLPLHLAPESAMLCCDLCGSRVGLWTFFPKMQPLVMTGGTGGRRDGAGRANTSGGISSSISISSSSMLPPGTIHSPSKSASSGKNVLANTVTTIAGGALQESSEAATIMPAFGPFGSKTPSVPLFGAPEGAFSTGGGGGAMYTNVVPTSGGIDNNSNKRKSKRKGNEEEETEATLQQQQQQQQCATTAVLSIPKTSNGSSAKRPKLIPPSAVSLQHYNTADVKSMHPIAAHKSFCPWAHRAPQEGSGNEEDNYPGWLYCLNTLVHLAMNSSNNNNNNNNKKKKNDGDTDIDKDMMDGGTGHQMFDASALLRDVLRKVDG